MNAPSTIARTLVSGSIRIKGWLARTSNVISGTASIGCSAGKTTCIRSCTVQTISISGSTRSPPMTPRSTSSVRTRLSTRLAMTSFSMKVTRGLISRKAAIASGRTPAATDGRAAIRTCGLGPGTRVVARGVLPAHPALLGDELQVAVPLRRRGLGRGAGHGGRARRNDDGRARVALGHVGVDALLVVRAVRREGGDRVLDLVQQGADLGGVVFVAVGQGGGHDPAGLGVHAEMELPPRPAPLGAVLLDQPLARAVELQPRAVDQQVHGAGIAASA